MLEIYRTKINRYTKRKSICLTLKNCKYTALEKRNIMDTRVRSLVKGTIYRIISVVTIAIITYLYTKDLMTVTLVTFFSNAVFLLVFYIHERIWLKIKRLEGKLARSIAKMFTYITVCGIVIMSIITYLVTGSLEAMTGITLTYVLIKHIMYIFNELLWYKIKWGSERTCQN